MRFDQPTAPHARPLVSVPVVMRRVLLALVPAMLCHAWYFGPGLLVNFALTAVAALVTEAAVLRLRLECWWLMLKLGARRFGRGPEA